MKGKAFYKKIEKAPNAYWRGAKLESYGDEAYLRVALKTTGATYEITGDAIQRLTAADVDGLLVGKVGQGIADAVDQVVRADGYRRDIAHDHSHIAVAGSGLIDHRR